MSTLLICNTRLVNEGVITDADVFIKDGRIETIGSNLSHLSSDKFIDAKGLHLLPGIIDTQFSLSSEVFSETRFFNETQAAVVGGVTSVMLLPHLTESESTGLPSADQLQKLIPNLKNNLSVYAVAERDALDGLAELDKENTVGAVYSSMISPNDNFRFDSEILLAELLSISPLLVALEAEDMPSILESEESYRQVYGDNIPFQFHSVIRGDESCCKAVKSVLKVARKFDKPVHLSHVSSTKEIELIESAKKKNIQVTADVCSHFLTFSEADYEDRGQLLKYNPAIKSDIDRASLIQGLLDNNITNICSGHKPYPYEKKQGSYFEVAAGLPQAQFALPSILEHFQDEIFSLELIVEKTSHAVADNFSIEDRGYIREGYWADLVLVDIEESFIARNEDVLSEAGWTIFAGNEFRSSVVKTIVNGEVVWSKGDEATIDGAGAQMTFTRQ